MKTVCALLFCIAIFTSYRSPAYAESVTKEDAIKLVTERLDKLERFVCIYSLSYPGSSDGENPAYKRLVLAGRDKLKITEKENQTIHVYEEFQWFNYTIQKYPVYAPNHNLAFYDGAVTYYWNSEGNSAKKENRFNYIHVQSPPSVYMWIENWTVFPLSPFFKDWVDKSKLKEANFTVTQVDNVLQLNFKDVMGPVEFDIQIDPQKGLKRLATKSSSSGVVVIDEFQQVKEGLWFPQSGRLTYPGNPSKNEVKLTVLQVKSNDDVDANLFKNFPWDDPKYNTKFGLKWEGDNQRRTNRILFKDHPPSYFTSFFGMSLDEAYQSYLRIE